MKSVLAIATLVLATACSGGPEQAPPPNTSLNGLPITGSVPFAKSLGFTRCLDFNAYLRCRREGIMFAGEGPYSGAVDSSGTDGRSGFDQLTMWSEQDQFVVTKVGLRLLAAGWTLCRTGTADRGDQSIYTKAGSPVRVSIDASYWGKRRLRVLPEQGQPTGKCW